MNTQSIQLVLVGAHPDFRNMLKNRLALLENITLIGETDLSPKAFDQIVQARPDVAVVNIQSVDGNAVELIGCLRTCGYTMGILLLAAFEDAAQIKAALESGANSYVLKSTNLDEIVDAIRDVYEASRIPVQLYQLQIDRKAANSQ